MTPYHNITTNNYIRSNPRIFAYYNFGCRGGNPLFRYWFGNVFISVIIVTYKHIGTSYNIITNRSSFTAVTLENHPNET